MEFQSLILQINELEETARSEKARYHDEAIHHTATKKELEKALSDLAASQQQSQKLHEKITALETSKESDMKTILQLKLAVKDSKAETALLKESVDKEINSMREKRELFFETMGKAHAQIRALQSQIKRQGQYGKASEDGNHDVQGSGDVLMSAEPKPLISEPGKETEKAPETPMEIDVAQKPLSPIIVAESGKESEVEKETGPEAIRDGQVLMPNPEFLAEVADLKKKEIELTDLVSSRETEIKNLTEEFNQLDSYTNLLQQHLEKAQTEISSLHDKMAQPIPCRACGAEVYFDMEGVEKAPETA